jgi:hypothetical protein
MRSRQRFASRGIGVGMRHFLQYTVVLLYLSVLAATAAERYGEWSLEQPRSSVLTLMLKQSVSFDDKIATSEFGFICDRRKKSGIVGAILIPFDGTFENRQSVFPVLIQRNDDQYDPSDLLQHWKNGTEYIFLESKEDIDELAAFLKASDGDGVKTIHIFFPYELDASPQIGNHIGIKVSRFSDGFSAFQMACDKSQ